MLLRVSVTIVLALLVGGCSDSPSTQEPPGPTAPPSPARARLEISGRILGPVQSDDDADMRITLREFEGVSAVINFVRLTCSNQVRQEWGAGSFINEMGTNRIDGGATLEFERHYVCPNSGRPREILADLTDASGFHHVITAAPFHPDWPGT